MYKITPEVIRADIRGFEARITQVKERLRALATGHLPYPKHKKREKQRRELQDEINHVLRLIGYAREALTA